MTFILEKHSSLNTLQIHNTNIQNTVLVYYPESFFENKDCAKYHYIKVVLKLLVYQIIKIKNYN